MTKKKNDNNEQMRSTQKDDFEDLKQIVAPKKLEQIGPYKIYREIGHGAMGKVYQGYDSNMNRMVAIKIMLNSSGVASVDRQRFLREARIMGKLQHSNIVSVYDINFEGDKLYIVMEFIKGTPLSAIVKKKEALPARRSLQIIKQVALALEYAHNKGVIHRDLKPSNLMLVEDRPIVMDFGIAKDSKQAQITKTGDILGTPYYMSPEQIQGFESTVHIDIYALGVIMYQMLSGTLPIKGTSPTNTMYNVIHQDVVPLRKCNPELAEDIEALCHKAISKEIHQRYQSSSAFAEDIERFLKGEKVLAKPASLGSVITAKLKKHWMVIATLFVCFLLLMSIPIYYQRQQQIIISNYIAQAKMTVMLGERKVNAFILASNLLEKALEANPKSIRIKKQLYKVHKNIGFLALQKKDYLLARIMFKRCERLNVFPENLLKAVEYKEKKTKTKYLERIDRIMHFSLKRKEINGWYVAQIMSLYRPYILKRLIFYLKSKDIWQRRLAIQTLGKIGNTFTKINNKDVVEWLLEHLQKLNVHKNTKEAEDIVWALGWLKDERANEIVYQMRHKAGLGSIFYLRTELPYRWIPLPKKRTRDLKKIMAQAIQKQEKNDIKGAIVDFTRIIKQRPNYLPAYFSRGYARSLLKDFKGAIADYTQALKINPQEAEVYNNLAIVYEDLGDIKKALANYNKTIKLNPKYSNAYLNRGVIYKKTGQFKKALADYSQVIHLNPEDPAPYHNRAHILHVLKKLDQAIVDYSKAIELNPRYISAYINRGNVYKDKNNLEAALLDHTKAINLNPRLFSGYYVRGNVHLAKKDIDAAIKDYRQCIKLNPKYANAYANLGTAYHQKGKVEKAIVFYSKTIALEKNSLVAYRNRGFLLEQKKDFKNAIGDYSKLIKYYPKYPFGYQRRALLYLKLKKHYLAAKDFANYLQLYPNAPKAPEIRKFVQRYGKQK